MKYLGLISIFLFLGVSCNKNELGPYECASSSDSRLLPVTPWDEIAAGNVCTFIIDEGVDSIYVVRNEDQYSFLVNCIDGSPAIDFSKNSLLLGLQAFDDKLELTQQSVIKDCASKRYILTIETQVIEEGTPMAFYFGAVVPRIPDNYSAAVAFF